MVNCIIQRATFWVFKKETQKQREIVHRILKPTCILIFNIYKIKADSKVVEEFLKKNARIRMDRITNHKFRKKLKIILGEITIDTSDKYSRQKKVEKRGIPRKTRNKELRTAWKSISNDCIAGIISEKIHLGNLV